MGYFRFGIKLTIAFFAAGTIILAIFYFTLSPKVALLAYLYTGVAILTSWLYAGVLLFHYLRGRINVKNMLKTIGVMALNIPVGILYAYIMIALLEFARITFKNNTGKDISIVKIKGCDTGEIHDLKNGSSKTVWIKIPTDCQVDIEYEIGGTTIGETVAAYLTPSSGIIATYEIGSNKDVINDM
jgi:hypothetical protein